MQNNIRRRFMQGFLGVTGASLAAPAKPSRGASGPGFDVRTHGAAGDGVRLDTKAIQSAVDACAAAGGGTVKFPAGTYLSGTVFLKSRVTLHLEAGATLLGSKNLADYPVTVSKVRSYTDNYTDKSLIYGEDLADIAITGHGILDGQGAAFQGPYKVRPYMIRFIRCRNVLVSDVAIRNSPMWVQHYLACDEVTIRGISVHSRVNHNNDGIDIDGCERVRISDCEITSGDDAIVLKSTLNRPCKDVVVTNCVLSTACNALKLGTESNGGFENIVISNCSIYETNLAGIALEIVDGGTLDRVTITNIAMQRTAAPIFIRLGDRARPFEEGGPRPPAGKLRNVIISNIVAVAGRNTGCSITGLAGHEVENVTLENIRMVFPGGGTLEQAQREIPEAAEKYPEFSMFGVLSAYGLFCRHVRNLNLRNIETHLVGTDARPALICDDVEDMELAGCRFSVQADTKAAVKLRNVRGVFVHGCRAARPGGEWLEVSEESKGAVVMEANDFRALGK